MIKVKFLNKIKFISDRPTLKFPTLFVTGNKTFLFFFLPKARLVPMVQQTALEPKASICPCLLKILSYGLMAKWYPSGCIGSISCQS